MEAPLIQRLASLWKRRFKQNITPSPDSSVACQRPPGFALEPRIMLDAALVSTGAETLAEADSLQEQTPPPAVAPSNQDELAEALESINPPATSKDVFFIDPSVPDYETLLADIPENAGVHILSSSASLQEIAGILAEYENLDAVHIISHGSTGSLSLSGETVHSDSLEASQEALTDIGRSLNDDGDILLYGCNVGAEGEGQNFIEQLAELTSADVAASDDITGKGGDWELEAEEGEVTALAFSAIDFQNQLAETTFTFENVVVDGGDPVPATETVGGITVSIKSSAPNYFTGVLDYGDLGDINDEYLIVDNNKAGLTPTVTITFEKDNSPISVDVRSIVLTMESIDAAAPPTLVTLTLTPGDNSGREETALDLGLLAIKKVDLNWSNVSTIEITPDYAYNVIGIDNLVIGSASPPANSAPTLTGLPSGLPVTEDTPGNLVLSAATFADSDGDTITATFSVDAGTFTSLADGSGVGAGVTETLAGNSRSFTLQGSAADINTYLDAVSNIQYTGVLNANGDNAATLTVTATDGTDAMSVQTANIDITAQNDAPTVAGVPTDVPALAETASNLDLSATTFADVDGDSLTVTLSASTGTMTASSGGGVTIGGSGSGSLTLSGTAANINSYLDTVSNIQYTGASGVSGDNAATLTISASDGEASLASNPTVNIDISAALTDGDIAFTRYGSDNETFSFVVLVDISPGTEFFITDEGWNGSGFHSNESTLKFVVNSQINAGEEFHITAGSLSYSTTSGGTPVTITSVGAFHPNLGNMLGTFGDNLFVYQAGPTPNVIAGLNADNGISGSPGNAWFTSASSATNGTVLPGGKTNGSGGFMGLFPNGVISEVDNARFKTTATHEGDKDALLAAIMDLDNWEFDNGSAYGASATAFTVGAVNSAPVLDNSQSPVLTTINEDVVNGSNTGTTVADIVVDGSITDPDGSPVEAIAVIGVDNTNGVWQYSSDGSSWNDFTSQTGGVIDLVPPSTSPSEIRLLDSTWKVRFVPNQNWNGTAEIRFAAWDKTSGTAGGTTDGSAIGGSSAFSADPDTAQITVSSVEDAPEISGTSTGNVAEDGTLVANGSLTATDSDAGDTPTFTPQTDAAGTYGTFSINAAGVWSYTLNNSTAQSLDDNESVTDTFTVTAATGDPGESVTETVTISITGANDTPVVSGTHSGGVTEGNVGDAAVTASGSLGISDVDADDSPAFNNVASTTGDNGYGSFVLSSGIWTYTLDQSTVQDLDAGDTVTDTITYTATDTTQQTITMTITGSNDTPVVSGTHTGSVTEGNVGDAAVTATGTLGISDVDGGDTPAFNDVASTTGDNGYGAFVLAAGSWTYTLDQSTVQDLDAGDTVTDTITYAATDSTQQTITVTITGSNDTPVVSGTHTGSVTEGNVGDAAVTATGTLGISDVDGGDTPAFNDVASTTGDNGYGAFVLAAGSWTYTLDQLTVQDLDAGEQVSDTITYTATDGTDQQITVTITGSNDAPVISGTHTGSVTEGNVGDAAVTATGTLGISDVDGGDTPSFNDQASAAGDNGYGSFVLSSGTWTYTLDQSTVQDLDAGEQVNDTITYTATDGTSQQITVTITGSDDASVISGTYTGSVTEGNVGDAAVTATGTLGISDVDGDDSPSFNDQASTAGDNAYGSFVLTAGSWTYTLNQSAVQELDAGEQVNDTITYTATDGTNQQITVTITGSNDASVISGTYTGSVTEGNVGDAAMTATGTLGISDVDGDDNPTFNDQASTAGDNAYGSFVLNSGIWTYTLDQSAVQNLDAGEQVNDTITYTATDGTDQQITVTITGSNDAPVISGTHSGAVTEGNIGDAAVTATGTLGISDVDGDDTPSFNDRASTIGGNGYGSFVLSSGTWTYTLDQSAVQNLDAGEQVNDTITYTATDNTTQTITVTITGSNDAPVISGTHTGSVTEGNVGDAAVTATGTLGISDLDGDDTPSFNDQVSTTGDNSYGSFVLSSGTWTYTLDQSAVQNLDAGEQVNDTITYTATDGTNQQITVTITGSNDASVISGTYTGSVTEGNVGDAAVTATGALGISDVDGDDNPTFNDQASAAGDNAYGSFVLSSGTWTYTLDQSAVQNLDTGEQVNDTITYTATDNTTQTITVTITGSNDAPVISGTHTGSVTEGNVGDAAVTATGTLGISDLDGDDTPSFNDQVSTTGDNSYGSFVLSSGTWTYTLDQSAVQNLDAGEQVNDTITYTATDGTNQQITVTITGSNDASVISGTYTGSVTEGNVGDAAVTATGALGISDVDGDDNPAFNDQASTAGDNAYGSFVLNSGIWTYTLDQSAVQNLDAGEQVNDTITYTATDGTDQQITVTITGSNDAPVISGTHSGAVTEGNIGDAAVTATGTLGISDVDGDDTPSFNDRASTIGGNGYGSFVLSSGTWTYTLDQSAVQNLDAGEQVNDTITYTATDNTTQTITVTITGSNDAPVISGTHTGSVTEGNVGDAAVTATGTLGISDLDGDDTPSFNDQVSTTGDNSYGSFVLSSGTWTYTLDQSAVQNLDAGEQVNDTITYTATDGTNQQITVTITGSNDASVISGTYTGSVTEGNVGDAAVTATGALGISDVDGDDNPTFNDQASAAGDNAYGSFVLSSGTWTYTLDQSAVQNLDTGEQVNDTITYTATDGTAQQITVTITGSNDAPVISGTHTGSVTEGNVGDAAVTATGTLGISDVDGDDSPSFNDQASTAGDNAYGSFVLNSGIWTYTLDQSAVQNLDAGEQVSDTITYTATDTTIQTITVTITGSNDAPVISGTHTGAVTEGNVGDAAVTATGTLGISDVDGDDTPSFNDRASTIGDNSYGSFVLSSGAWTYTLDQSAVQNLDAGEQVNDTITYTATDGTAQQITVTITGSNDAPVISGTHTGSVTEGNVGDAAMTATGTLGISDVDGGDNPSFNDQASTAGDNAYGSFVLSSGTWTYTLDQSAVQNLDAGEQVSDTITYTATDTTTQTITVTITGSNDAPTISGTHTGAVTEGNIGDAAVTATGTLGISDVDGDDTPSFNDRASTIGGNGYGSFVLSSGTWTYTLDQSAVQNLDAGEQVNDTITYTATDNTTQTITVTITGSNDAPVISGTHTGSVTEGNVGDAAVTATGTLGISDLDGDDTPSFNDQVSTTGDNSYGSFVLSSGTWTYTLDQSAVQNLDAGEQVNDTITYTATDGTDQQITVTITGSNDAPVISGTHSGAVTEGNIGDAAVTATGTLGISDVDGDDTPSFNDRASTIGGNGYGSFVLSSGTWTYTLDQSAVQNLDAGEQVNDTITYTATDNTTQTITVTITGSNDAPTISGTHTGSVTEGNLGDAAVTATGTLGISDVDGGDNPSFNDQASAAGDNGYGSFILTAGSWTYTLNQSTVQDLDAGEQVNDTITYTATDGTSQQITVTITGSNDAPVISGTHSGAVTEGNIGDAAVTATGTLGISDVDGDDTPSFNDRASTIGDNSYGSFVLSSGAWTYTLDQSAVQNLDAGEQVNDTITYTATDGTAQQITVTITGSNDAPVISGTHTGSVTEGNVGDAAMTATGTLGISDVDGGDNPSFNDQASTAGDNAYGSFVLSSGTWTYTLDQSAVQNLDAGEQVSDTITYTATDTTTQTITVTITGSNDAPTISGTHTGAVTEGNIGDAAVTATGTLGISDVDGDDTPSFNDRASTIGGNGYGSFVLSSGTWTYTLDQSAVQNLDAGEQVNDTITYTATDNTTQTITVTITGSNDAPTISGTHTGSVTEGNLGDAAVTATGTLGISDVDGGDNPSFNDQASAAGDNGYGSFILTAGSWTYTLNQSTVQDLDAGEQVNDTITYTATDGTSQQITVTITGSDDASVISGTYTGSVTEGNVGDAAVTATGALGISDVDGDDNPAFNDQVSTAGDNGYGSFVLSSGTWTYTLDQSAVQNLDAGEQVNDTITYTATDTTTQTITVTITGSNDAPTISGTHTGSVTEGNLGDAAVTATGTLGISDVDGGDNPSFNDQASAAGDNGYGSFILTAGSWTYTLNQSTVQDLDAGEQVNDTITYTATDGTSQQITVTITGSDDASVISGTYTGSVTEGNLGDAAVTATGTLGISDVDGGDNPSFNDQASAAGDNGYGSFILTAGSWTYTLNQSTVQDLDAGEQVNDTITYTATDGTSQQITVTITGSDDASVISGTYTGSVTEGNVGDAAVTATGALGISDVDGDDNPAFNDQASTAGDNAYGSFVLNSGAWTYTLDQSAVQNLDAGEQVNDTITYTATDNTTQTITVTITGSNDAPTISGTHTGSVTEGNVGDAAVTATGTLGISDVDGDDSPSFNDQASTAGDNAYGSFVLTAGSWTYTLNQSAVQELDAGEQVNDTVTYTATDGTDQQITVTITGSNDASVISGTYTGSVTEGNVGDAAMTATGTLGISDVDGGDNPSFNDQASTAGDNAYGSFVLSSGTWTYTLDQSAVQNLDAGEQVSDTITYTATDTTTQTITVTITGSNDAPTISGTHTGSVTEGNLGDAAVTATGTLGISDVDGGDNPSFNDQASAAGDNGYGSFILTAGSWTYTLNQSTVQDLDAGEQVNDTVTYTATDGTDQQITVTITGSNDASVISGTYTGSVTEGNVGDAAMTATGTLGISDVDGGDNPSFNDQASTAGDNAYGSFVLSSGTWTYTLDQSAVQNLDAGEQVNDTITYTATDTTTQTITVTITGSNDAPVISGTHTGAVTEGNVGDVAVTANGTLGISDVDGDDTPSFNDQVSTTGDNSYGSFVLSSGTWTYTLDQSAVQNLDAGEQVNDTITYTATDGTNQQITVTITGSDDASIISGTHTGSVTEGNVGDAAVTATGALGISDVDGDDNPTFNDQASTAGDNAYGSFVLSSGTWTYTLDQSAVQNLDTGEQVNDTITYTATDGTNQQITVTITGSNDAPVLTVTDTTGAITENDALANLTYSGELSFSDLDANDNHSVKVSNSSAVKNGNSLGRGARAFTTGISADSNSWNYTVANSAVNSLKVGETITVSFDVTVNDGTDDSNTERVTLTITGTNDAPVISGEANLDTIKQGIPAVDPDGTSVTDLFGGKFSDADTNQFAGIAIAGDASDSSQGAWEYSTDGGSTWFEVGSVDADSALLLEYSADVKLRFLPASGWEGTPGDLTIHAVDDSASQPWSSGSSRETFDTASDDQTSRVSVSGISLSTQVDPADPVANQAASAPLSSFNSQPSPVVESEPGIPDPLQNSGGTDSSQQAETPGSNTQPGTGSSGDGSENLLAVQGLFGDQSAIDNRYGTGLMTGTGGGSNSGTGTGGTSDTGAGSGLGLPGAEFEAQQQETPEEENDKKKKGQDAGSSESDGDSAQEPSSEDGQEAGQDEQSALPDDSDFSSQLAMAADSSGVDIRKLKAALDAVSVNL